MLKGNITNSNNGVINSTCGALINSTSYNNTLISASICDAPLSKRYLALAVFSAVVAFMGVVGNTLAISVFVFSKKFRQRISNSFLVSLAFADLGVTAFVTSVKVDRYYHNNSFCHGLILCAFFQITDSLFPITSLTHLLILCIDRWYAVTKPYQYRKFASRRKAKQIIGCIWVYSLLWTLFGVLKWEYPAAVSYELIHTENEIYCYSYNRNYITTLSVVIYFIPMCILMKLSTYVVRLARQKSMQMNTPVKAKRRRFSVQGMGIGSKAMRTVGAVSIAYIICWLPHFTIIVIQYWWMHVLANFSRYSPEAYDIVTTIINNILPTLSSCLNPFIYCLFSEQFRVESSDLIRQWMGRPRYWAHMYSEEENIPLYTIHEREEARDRKISLPVRMRPTEQCSTNLRNKAMTAIQRSRSFSM